MSWRPFQAPSPSSRVPRTPVTRILPSGRKSYRVRDPDEGSPCLNATTVMAVTSGCIMSRFDGYYYLDCQRWWYYDSQLDDVIPALLATCRSFGVRPCSEPSCIDNLAKLEEFVPQSNHFFCLRAWVMQVVACHQSLRPDIQTSRGRPEPFHLVPKEPGYGLDRWQADPEPLAEVLSLISWFNGYFGSYKAISPPAPLRKVAKRDVALIEAYGAEMMREEVDKAVERVKNYNVCLHRAWAVVSRLPGRELNLPALIPDPDSPIVHPHLDQGDEHKKCTKTFCHLAKIKTTNLEQLHVCESQYCELTEDGVFPTWKLLEAIENEQLTAWSLDGLSVFGGDAFNRDFSNHKEPFIAISHVWADGTGTGGIRGVKGRVNSCLFDMFCDIAQELNCKGIWWDTICLPYGEDLKKQHDEALQFMERNYSAARYTVVHDSYLRNMPWIDAESACLALVLSPWFTRGWTALELSSSDDIYVIFAQSDDPSDGYVLKNLDRDFLVPERVGGTACQLITRAIIQAFRKESRAQLSLVSRGISYRNLQVNDILLSLSGRTTLKPRDMPRIASMFAKVDIPSDDPNKIDPLLDPLYCRRVLQGRAITAENLFHMAMPADGFGWQPTSFFDLPVSTRSNSAGVTNLRIPAPPKDELRYPGRRTRNRCDVIGRWDFICDPSPNADLAAFRKVCFTWQVKNKKAITDAVRSTRHHVILVDISQRYPTRGILVKVRRWNNPDGTMRPSNAKEIFGAHPGNLSETKTSFPCEFVGVVHFSSSELPKTSAATFVLFGSDDSQEQLAIDLHPRESAGSIIISKVQECPYNNNPVTSPVFAQKENNVGRWQHEWQEENIWKEEYSIPDFLPVPKMQLATFNSKVSGSLALSGYDEVELGSPYGLFIVN